MFPLLAGPGWAAPAAARCPAKFLPNFLFKQKSFSLSSLHMKSPDVPQQPPPRRLPSRRGRCPRGGQAEAAAKSRYLRRPGAGGVPHPRRLLRLLRRRPPARLALRRGRRREGGRKEKERGSRTAPPPPAGPLRARPAPRPVGTAEGELGPSSSSPGQSSPATRPWAQSTAEEGTWQPLSWDPSPPGTPSPISNQCVCLLLHGL